VTRPAREQLEPRQLLASQPAFIHDRSGERLAVEPEVQAKLGDLLALISAEYESLPTPGADYSPPGQVPRREWLSWEDGESIVVAAVAQAGGTAELRAALEELGGPRIVSSADSIAAAVPFGALDELAAVPSLRYADAAVGHHGNGAIVNQAGLALEADLARARGCFLPSPGTARQTLPTALSSLSPPAARSSSTTSPKGACPGFRTVLSPRRWMPPFGMQVSPT